MGRFVAYLDEEADHVVERLDGLRQGAKVS
jgi:hypothetical protein